MGNKTNNNSGCLIIGIIAIIIIGVVIGISAKSCSPDVKCEVWTYAEDVVKDQLKAPSTASFPSDYESYVTDNGDGTYSVSAYVDSENSFGAKIRSDFSLTVKKEGDSYSSKDLDIESN